MVQHADIDHTGIPGVPTGSSGGTPVGQKIVRATSNYTTTSATFVDVDAANLTLTITTEARRVLIGVVATAANSDAAGRMDLGIKVDGSMPNGAWIRRSAHDANEFMNGSFTFLSDVLTAASHSFVLQFARGGSGTLTLNADATNPLEFWVMETMLEA